MTTKTSDVILHTDTKGRQIRKGEAMLQRFTNGLMNTDCLFDLQGTIMPAAEKAEWLISVRLHKTGSSGYLGPGALVQAMEWPEIFS